MSVVDSKVMNRPFCRDIAKICECVCATESNGVEQKNTKSPRLDRSAWKPCEQCRNGNTIIDVPACDQFGLIHNGKNNEQLHFLFQFQFCPHCGRPLTDDAWEMLEKRLESAK